MHVHVHASRFVLHVYTFQFPCSFMDVTFTYTRLHVHVCCLLFVVKDPLTHRPSSQGWASWCLLGLFFFLCVMYSVHGCVPLFVWVGITFLPLYSLASVLCTCIYNHVMNVCVGAGVVDTSEFLTACMNPTST